MFVELQEEKCCDDGLDLGLGVLFPGSEIPEWFGNQTVGDTATLHLPPHFPDKCLGFALCVILSPNDTFVSSWGISFELTFREDGKDTYRQYQRIMRGVRVRYCPLKEDHVVFGFASLCRSHWPKNFNHIIECSVKCAVAYSKGRDDAVKVKKCAVRLVDLEERTQPTTISSPLFLEFGQVCGGVF